MRTRGRHFQVMCSSPEDSPCTLNLSRLKVLTFEQCGRSVEGGRRAQCHPHHFAEVRNYEVLPQQPPCCFTMQS
ncbi:hypothetical protein TNCV_4113431 [Trichonephila clavipes]|nr:hypothetical protein TNCV_4113431 [Trichonephila clavipes]